MSHLEYAPLHLAEAQDVLKEIQGSRGEKYSEIWMTMLHHIPLTRGVSNVGQILRFHGTLSSPLREAVILYIAHATHCSFEWDCHTDFGQRAGVPEEIVSLIGQSRPLSAYPEPYRDVLEAAEMALQKKSLPDPLQTRLIEQYGKNGLVEIVLLSGYYQMLASFLNAFEVRVAFD